ncbi:MAG: EamA family transporter [Clostridia bacterium]|nr:EamA family transporter [Clostridia bacterium]
MNQKKGTLLVVLAALSWSVAGVLGKYTTWSPLATAGMRAIIAAIIMAVVRGGVKIKFTKSNLWGAFGCAATSIIFVIANKLTTAANAIVLQYAMTAVVIFFNWLVYRQKPTRRDLITAVFVIIGVVLCSADDLSGGSMLGNLLAIVTAFTFALVFFCSKLPGANATDYNFLGLALCTPCIFFAFNDPGATITAGNILALLGMGLGLAGGYIFISKGMKYATPLSAAITANIEPVLNPLWVFIFLGEAPGITAILGAIVVLTTVTLYSLPQSTIEKLIHKLKRPAN